MQNILTVSDVSGNIIAILSFQQIGNAMIAAACEIIQGNWVSLHQVEKSLKVEQFDKRIRSLQTMQ